LRGVLRGREGGREGRTTRTDSARTKEGDPAATTHHRSRRQQHHSSSSSSLRRHRRPSFHDRPLSTHPPADPSFIFLPAIIVIVNVIVIIKSALHSSLKNMPVRPMFRPASRCVGEWAVNFMFFLNCDFNYAAPGTRWLYAAKGHSRACTSHFPRFSMCRPVLCIYHRGD